MINTQLRPRTLFDKTISPVTMRCVILITAFCPNFAQADTDVLGFINSLLLSKHIMVNKIRTIRGEKTVCTLVSDGRPHKDCQTFEVDTQQTYSDQARVKAVSISRMTALKFDSANMNVLPATANIERIDYYNCGQDPFGTGVTLAISKTDGYSVSKTHTLSITAGVTASQNFSVGNGLFGGSTTISVNASMTTSDTTTNSENHSETITETLPISITVGISHAGYLQGVIIEQNVEIPYSSDVIVDGILEDNSSGISKASQILTDTERTLPFSGVIKATGATDILVGNQKPDVPMSCDDPKTKGQFWISPPVHYTVPVASIPADLAQSFGTLKDFSAQRLPRANLYRYSLGAKELLVIKPNADTIGPANGLSYQVISASDVTVADVACGFNDFGVPNMATHHQEIRHYTDYQNGILLNQYDEVEDTFVSCVPQ